MSETPKHAAIVDLGYGDAGKGSVVDWLCSEGAFEFVVRFNGGAQAAHNVVLADGRHHTFAQFGSGTLRGVKTILSHLMIVDPIALVNEAAHLETLGVVDPLKMLRVDGSALVSTPLHQAVNIARELARGEDRHGSCGVGIGETMRYFHQHQNYALRMWDLTADGTNLTQKINALYYWAMEQIQKLGQKASDFDLPSAHDYRRNLQRIGAELRVFGNVDDIRFLISQYRCLFEGAQGVLLDQDYGFHPYTTWSTTTFENVRRLTKQDPVQKIGVLRTYTTRHGAGPLVTEDPTLDIPEAHNGTGPWQGAFRIGHFDAVAHRYALEVAGDVDGLVLTHLDTAKSHPELTVCNEYQVGDQIFQDLPVSNINSLGAQALLTAGLKEATPVYEGQSPSDWVHEVEYQLGAPVLAVSEGPTAEDKREIRYDAFREYGIGARVAA